MKVSPKTYQQTRANRVAGNPDVVRKGNLSLPRYNVISRNWTSDGVISFLDCLENPRVPTCKFYQMILIRKEENKEKGRVNSDGKLVSVHSQK